MHRSDRRVGRRVTTVDTTEHLYGLATGEDPDGYIRSHVVAFPITKRTAKRIYYVRRTHPNGTRDLGYVNRQAMEAAGADGLWARRSGGWWEPDAHLYLTPPVLPAQQLAADLKADVDRLRREAADAHPDRGGSNEAFIHAHQRLTAARGRLSRAERAA